MSVIQHQKYYICFVFIQLCCCRTFRSAVKPNFVSLQGQNCTIRKHVLLI
jgi:hypothetical protein